MKCDCFIIIFYGEKTMDLFEYAKSKTLDQESPLASRLRPTTLDEVVGQQHIIGKNTLLYRAIKADKLTSVIFYGPPGTGKTTLAKVIANTTSAEFTQINATVAGKKDMEAVVKEAQQNLGMYGKKTILFIDEIHRFNKGQQDYLLPFVEDGTIILIGATTENPYFEVNAALISRSIIFELKSLEISEVKELILRAVNDKTKGMGNYKARIDEDALDFLADMAGGDARNALNAIELGILTTPRSEDGLIHITLDVASQCIQKRVVRYDKNGDNHYDIISAFIKSIRGSDPDGAIYWLARMVEGGEDPALTDEWIEKTVAAIHCEFPDCAITLSLGEKSREAYERFFRAGANRYLLRHETHNEEHYRKLHPEEMSLKHRLQCLQWLKEIGYQTGTGIMVGTPGQTLTHLVEDLLFIEQFQPQMIGIGPFIPHHDTPFGTEPAGSVGMTLKLLSLFRLMHPSALIPSTTALATLSPDGREKGILAGANVVMPNLSPREQREKYTLYDNKAAFGAEAAEGLRALAQQLETIGYRISTDRGDYH